MEIVATTRALVDSLQNLGRMIDTPEMPDLPTDADCLIFVNEVEAIAAQMPTDVVGLVAMWKVKCTNVVILGQEMSTTAAHVVMLSQIDIRTLRLLLQLICVLHIQNVAIKYEYLYAASGQLNSWPVSWDPRRFQAHLLCHRHFGGALSGNDWQFLNPEGDTPTFPIGYSRVRIRHVELEFQQSSSDGSVVHQPRTNGGLIYMLLQSSRFFSDRKQRQIMKYEATMGMSYAFAYNLQTGVPTLTNIPSTEYATTFMRMTPFNQWRLRLSSSAEEN
ncbi:hypothetical protein L7F22_056090 [Adiantum nelumboides]|nr:hypothetical protein [Adiantum nelumboides]